MTPTAASPPARRPASPQRPGCADLLLELRYPLTFERDEYPDEIDVTTASLDDPEAMPPRDQTHTKTRLRWVCLADGLPTYPDRHRDFVMDSAGDHPLRFPCAKSAACRLQPTSWRGALDFVTFSGFIIRRPKT